MRRRVLRIATLLTSVGLVAVAAAVAATPVAIKATIRNETAPAAGGDWFAWSKSRSGGPSPSDVWAQHGTEPAFKVNPRDTQAFTGGIDGNRLVYQLLLHGGARGSDLRLYDLQRRTHLALGAGVNTKRWECCPTISGDWLLFDRGLAYNRAQQLLILRNLATREERVLDRLSNRNGILSAGQISGNYAVWAKCNPYPKCQIFRYDIAARTSTPLAVPAGKVVYSPSVTAAGTTYYGRSRPGCGKTAELVKERLDGTAQVLVSLPAGQDLDVTSAILQAEGPTELPITRVYYDRVVCRRKAWDIFAVIDIEKPIPPPP